MIVRELKGILAEVSDECEVIFNLHGGTLYLIDTEETYEQMECANEELQLCLISGHRA